MTTTYDAKGRQSEENADENRMTRVPHPVGVLLTHTYAEDLRLKRKRLGLGVPELVGVLTTLVWEGGKLA